MFEVGVVVGFEAAHRLQGDFGSASRTHGHTYRVEVTARGEDLQADGTLCDIGALRAAAEAVAEQLNHRDLDELDVFVGRNTTAEIVAQHVLNELRSNLQSAEGVTTLVVRVWESPTAYAAFEAALR